MGPYKLNMARGFVMPLESRRKWLRWFFTYLVAMGVVITWTLYDVIRRIEYCQTQHKVLEQREKRMLAGQAEFKTMGGYRASLEREVAVCGRDLESVVAFWKRDFPVGKILLGLAAPLPEGVELSRVDLSDEGGKLGITVAVPADVKGYDNLTPPNMVALWENEPLLAGVVSQISVETSERVHLNGLNVVSWRFSAIVEGD